MLKRKLLAVAAIATMLLYSSVPSFAAEEAFITKGKISPPFETSASQLRTSEESSGAG